MLDKTAIMVVLDESPSMTRCASETIEGFNRLLSEQQASDKPATMSLIKFSRRSESVYVDVPIRDVPHLNGDTYFPCVMGSTSLFDAVGCGINALGKSLADLPEQERPNKVIFVVITDGNENSSKEFSGNEVRSMIKKQTDEFSWTFLFLGAEIDAKAGAASIGIAASNAVRYDKQNTQGAYAGLSGSITRSRANSGPSENKGFSDDERSAIEK